MQRAMSHRSALLAAAAACALTLLWASAHAGCGGGGAGEPEADASAATDGTGDGGVRHDVAAPGPDAKQDAEDQNVPEAAFPLDAGPDAPWYASADGWTQVTQELGWFEPCSLWLGDVTKLKIPALQWTSCGEGCDVVGVAEGQLGYVPPEDLSGENFGGRPLLQFAFGFPDPSEPVVISRIVDLDTGEALAAFMLKYHVAGSNGPLDCGGGALPGVARAHSLLRLREGEGDDGGDETRVGTIYWDPTSAKWINIDPPVPISYRGVAVILDSLPGAAVPTFGPVYVSESLRPLSYKKIFSGYSGDLAALGDQVVFPDLTYLPPVGHGKVMSWSPSTGLQTLVTPDDYDPFVVALSETHIVWAGAPDMNDEVESPTNMARFYWTPRAHTPAQVQVHQGAQIPQSPAKVAYPMQTYGDYAAAMSGVTVAPGVTTPEILHEKYRIAVTQLSTGKLWMLKARSADRMSILPLAITGSHIYVAEGLRSSAGAITVVVRYAIDKLDVLASL